MLTKMYKSKELTVHKIHYHYLSYRLRQFILNEKMK